MGAKEWVATGAHVGGLLARSCGERPRALSRKNVATPSVVATEMVLGGWSAATPLPWTLLAHLRRWAIFSWIGRAGDATLFMETSWHSPTLALSARAIKHF